MSFTQQRWKRREVTENSWEVFLACVLIAAVMAPDASLAVIANAKPAENPWGNYRFAPDALREIDLASDTAWTLSVDNGPPRPIKVTAGGWNSDQQTPPIPSDAAKDHVVYRRRSRFPARRPARP